MDGDEPDSSVDCSADEDLACRESVESVEEDDDERTPPQRAPPAAAPPSFWLAREFLANKANKFQILGSITIPKQTVPNSDGKMPFAAIETATLGAYPNRIQTRPIASPQRPAKYGEIVHRQTFVAGNSRPSGPRPLAYGAPKSRPQTNRLVPHAQKTTNRKTVVYENAIRPTRPPCALDAPKRAQSREDAAGAPSNQDLTAQILQSLSQPKRPLASRRQTCERTPLYRTISQEPLVAKKPIESKKRFPGDAGSGSPSDEGFESRPTLSSECHPRHHRSLQIVMLDHTYAVSTQTVSNPSMNGSGVPTNDTCQVIDDVSSPIGHTKNVVPKSSPPVDGVQLNPPPMALLKDNSNARIPTTLRYDAEDDDAASTTSSIEGDRDDRIDGRHDSDTETAPEGEEEGKTRCVCEFTHDDGYMICCDRCGEWQHVDCMGIDRQNIPDDYMCDRCEPRYVDRKRARSVQIRKREELTGLGSSGSDSSSGVSVDDRRVKRTASATASRKRPLTVTTYSNTIGGVSRAVSSSSFSPPYSSDSPQIRNKRTLKRPRKVDDGRKGPKRRIPEKRKRKSADSTSHRSKFCSGAQRSNQWTDSYESAVTNHYSPELRAKIARYCSNGGANNESSTVLTVHACTTVPHAGGKILIATADVKENTPIIELRGKYMLSNQHKPQPQPSGRVGGQKPGPFLFFYRLPKDSTQICIDTRTYGNEARFVRRSCKPNAELQHRIVKGALHVYLVTTAPVRSDTEISIEHDSTGSSQPCACGNPKHCKRISSLVHKNNGAAVDGANERRGRTRLTSVNNSSVVTQKYDEPAESEPMDADYKSSIEADLEALKKETILEKPIKVEEADESEFVPKQELKTDENIDDIKSDPSLDEDDEPLKSKIKEEPPEKDNKETVVSDVKDEEQETKTASLCKASSTPVKCKEEKPKKTIGSRRSSAQPTRTTRASTSAVCAGESADEKSDTQSDSKGNQTPKDKKKMTREERKMEAIMKAFERLEKAELRKQENRDRQSRRRESDSQQPTNESKDQNDDDDSMECSNLKRRRRKKGRTRTPSQNNQIQRNRNRLNSVDSDMVTSGEESASLLSPPSNNKSVTENYSDNTIEPANYMEETMSDTLHRSVTRLNVGLSSACLLVEAAVGPLESTFKFPKRKKAMMNQWLSKSPERNAYETGNSMEFISPPDNNNMSTLAAKKMFAGEKFENLMKVANTMIGNFDETFNETESENVADSSGSVSPMRSPSQKGKKTEADIDKKLPKRYKKGFKNVFDESLNVNKRTLRSNAGVDPHFVDSTSEGNATPPHDSLVMPPEVNEATSIPQPAQHSAKKRWLRQAISEESDSPTQESPPSEMVTPLKKRRLARESLSLDRPFGRIEESNCQNLQVKTSQASPDDNCKFPPKFDETTKITSFTEVDVNMTRELTLPIVKPDSETVNNVSLVNVEAPIEVTSTLKSECEDKSNLEVNGDETNASKDNTRLEDSFGTEKGDSCGNINSTETSGNSSPVLDEMDDIQKKIHTFHTENIQILKIRNKKQPKEKRKKVNLNFDLCVLADQTIGVKLKSEEASDEDNSKSESNRVDSSCVNNVSSDSDSVNKSQEVNGAPKKQDSVDKGFMCTPLFSGDSTPDAQMPDPNVIKNAIDMTTSLEIGIKSNCVSNKIDEYKNVQEILSRVNQMDSHNSVLLSGVLRDSNHSLNVESPSNNTNKMNLWRANDPRLNPPPAEKPKPVRRKLSITEYRRRHSMLATTTCSDQDGSGEVATAGQTLVCNDLPDTLKSDRCIIFRARIDHDSIIESINEAFCDEVGKSTDTSMQCSPVRETNKEDNTTSSEILNTINVSSEDVSSQIEITR